MKPLGSLVAPGAGIARFPTTLEGGTIPASGLRAAGKPAPAELVASASRKRPGLAVSVVSAHVAVCVLIGSAHHI